MDNNERESIRLECQNLLTNIKYCYSKNRHFSSQAECEEWFKDAFKMINDVEKDFASRFPTDQDKNYFCNLLYDSEKFLSKMFLKQTECFRSLNPDALHRYSVQDILE